MVVASGFVETNELNHVERVTSELNKRRIEVSEVNGEKIIFLIERETMVQVKAELDSLNGIEGVRNVYLAYYSLEGSDKDLEADGKDKVV